MNELTQSEIEVLIHLVKTEMSGFCGDRGYEELSAILKKLDNLSKDLS